MNVSEKILLEVRKNACKNWLVRSYIAFLACNFGLEINVYPPRGPWIIRRLKIRDKREANQDNSRAYLVKPPTKNNFSTYLDRRWKHLMFKELANVQLIIMVLIDVVFLNSQNMSTMNFASNCQIRSLFGAVVKNDDDDHQRSNPTSFFCCESQSFKFTLCVNELWFWLSIVIFLANLIAFLYNLSFLEEFEKIVSSL